MSNRIDKFAGNITAKISSQKNDYVNHRIVENALKLGDTFSNSKKAKYLSKVAKKANSDWLNANKIKNFDFINHSSCISYIIQQN